MRPLPSSVQVRTADPAGSAFIVSCVDWAGHTFLEKLSPIYLNYKTEYTTEYDSVRSP